MATYAALVSLLNNIDRIMDHPRLSTSLDKKDIQPLLKKIDFLLEFIKGNSPGGGSKELQDLERKIASAAHKGEDLIESHIVDQIHTAEYMIEPHIVDQIHEERLGWPYLLTFLLKCVGCHISDRSENSLDLQQINQEMDAIVKEAKEFKGVGRSGGEQQPTHQAGSVSDGGRTDMVGREVELSQLLDELESNQPDLRIISIVGMGGAGKTTLARSVYEKSVKEKRFQFCAWAAVSQQNNRNEILSKLLSGKEEGDLVKQLHQTLAIKRYLIVLDDIWTDRAWNELKGLFLDKKNGSRIVLTTRLSNVCVSSKPFLFRIDFLKKESSWKLFCEKAFQDKKCPPELEKVGTEIVLSCKGLALSIVVVGGLLSKSPRSVGYWKEVAKNLKSIPNATEKEESLNVLLLSYNHLPPHLKPCFLYMGVFKEDSEIRVSKIINLWIAEGFIKPHGSLVPEEIAEGYINDLMDRNLILAGKRRKNGKVGSCGIHDLLRDLSIKLAEQEEFFHDSIHVLQGTERRLVDDGNLERMNVKLPAARSILTQECIEQLTEYRLLRVFDAVGYSSQANYYENFNLRYLAYDHPDYITNVWKLSVSVSLIWNLQTLNIENAFSSLIVAPTGFWKMPQLRHVKCYQIYLPCPPQRNKQDEVLMLEKLHTLKKVVNLRLCEDTCEIILNIKKLHLVYDSELYGYDDSLIECLCNVDQLRFLESLDLSIRSSTWLNPVRELNKKLTAPFLKSLKQFSLRCCEIQWDHDMTVIGSLPQLEVLNLDSLSVREGEGGEWNLNLDSVSDEQFRCLKFLKINSCDLFCWNADNCLFPALEKLLLLNLRRLKEIPSDIGNTSTLHFIHVDCCSDSAAISAVNIQDDQLQCGNKIQVQVRVLETHLESFEKMLETAELTIKNIQFQTL